LTAFVDASKGQGFGLHAFETLASGRLVLAPRYGGLCDYFDAEVGWLVEYDEVAVNDGVYVGHRCAVRIESLAEAMRAVAANPAEARRRGQAAARRLASWTWQRTSSTLIAALEEVGWQG